MRKFTLNVNGKDCAGAGAGGTRSAHLDGRPVRSKTDLGWS